MRRALSESSRRSVRSRASAASTTRTLAGQPTRGVALWRRVVRRGEGAPDGAPFQVTAAAPLGRRACRLRCRARRGGGRAVLELLLGAEQRVEHLLPQAFRQRERGTRRDDQEDHPPPPAAVLLRLGATQRVGRLAERARGLPQLALRLLVVDEGLRRALAVR